MCTICHQNRLSSFDTVESAATSMADIDKFLK